jgi:hypothetical protein
MKSDKGVEGISCGLVDDNVFEWEVMLMISDDCKFYGGKSSSLSNFSVNSDKLHRRLLSCDVELPTRVPSPTTEDEVRVAHFPPQQ